MEVAPSHRQVRVIEASQPSAARYAAHAEAESAGFPPDDVHRAGLVATELGTNLVKHARAGEILIRTVARGAAPEIELISIDRGPGITDVASAITDGHSTAGSSGNGLGAVRRLSELFDIYSQVDRGTVVLARLVAGRKPTGGKGSVTWAGVSVPIEGEQVCGDVWQAAPRADGAFVAIADGLGHGILAHDASLAAIRAIDPRDGVDLTALLRTMHDGIRHTRGAAAAVADIRRGVLKFAGVGNIAGTISRPGGTRQTVSLAGTLGHEARNFREYSYPWDPDSVFVMFSDGLGSHWSLDDYRGIRQRHPAVMAAALYRDYHRQRDDVTVVVAK